MVWMIFRAARSAFSVSGYARVIGLPVGPMIGHSAGEWPGLGQILGKHLAVDLDAVPRSSARLSRRQSHWRSNSSTQTKTRQPGRSQPIHGSSTHGLSENKMSRGGTDKNLHSFPQDILCACARDSFSDLGNLRHDERRPVRAAEHFVRRLVVREPLGRRVHLQLRAGRDDRLVDVDLVGLKCWSMRSTASRTYSFFRRPSP